MHQRDFGCVAGAVEHALAEKSAPQADAVEAADQFIAVVDLDRVAVAAFVELAVEVADASIDPGAGAAGHRLRAAVEHSIEIAIDDDRERA